MTLQTVPPINNNDLAVEFGGSLPAGITDYYAGGPYVPAGTEGINGPIPSSGDISLLDFLGAPVVDPGPPEDPFVTYNFIPEYITDPDQYSEGYAANVLGFLEPNIYRDYGIWIYGNGGYLADPSTNQMALVLINQLGPIDANYIDEIRVVAGPGAPYTYKRDVNLFGPEIVVLYAVWTSPMGDPWRWVDGAQYTLEISWKVTD